MTRSPRWIVYLSMILVTTLASADADGPSPFQRNFLDQFPDLHKVILKTKATTTPDAQHAAVEALIRRLLPPKDAARFLFDVNPSAFSDPAVDTAKITSNGKVVRILGNSGTACTFALYDFLKYQCGCQVAWSGRQLTLPAVFPVITRVVRKADWLHYYQNVCTASYSSVWWNWTRWEQEIDWMALQGINFPLAFTGQEEMWRRVYSKRGLNDDDLAGFFVGPAFLAWGRMGNIRRWDGPLSAHWLNGQVELQHKILERMASLGIIPILPAFGGIVPEALQRIYPQMKYSRLQSWSHFPDNMTRSYLLDPSDPLYVSLGQEFIHEMQAEYGSVTHFYNADTFNEQRPNTSSPDFVREVANTTYRGMIQADSEAIWVMQGWLFVYDSDFWTPALIEAFLTAAPLGRMILLDLDADSYPVYNNTQSFFGQPFIWCMLHNYGAVEGLYGRLSEVNRGPAWARNFSQSTMIGVGLSPEGIEQNEIIYEFMNEMSWRTSPTDLNSWVADFVDRRYGAVNAEAHLAFRSLQTSVWDRPTGDANQGHYALTRRPRLDLVEPIWYDPSDVYFALEHLLNATQTLPQSPILMYDLTDLGRQALQVAFHTVYGTFQEAVKVQNLKNATKAGRIMVAILTDMNALLSTNGHFSLEKWVDGAKSWSSTPDEERLYVQNALNQITLWGPDGNIIDYANKQWAGVVSRYYRPRWKLFLQRVLESIQNSKPFDQGAFDAEVFAEVEKPFTLRQYVPDEEDGTTGGTTKVLHTLITKYQDIFQ
ncbi:Alpha-N-acetylglucosaminidase [Hypsibius exemplaris]|uniref:Alpha-N-acetylglucosaminidase n=1 Tax=Hypsibius exemplaris TaxID=2072580 RepID=A0A9X6NBQ2_HYPEX|nr:Alpha-N-acetylglucosaminidase [Hypsibius exemplaris]